MLMNGSSAQERLCPASQNKPFLAKDDTLFGSILFTEPKPHFAGQTFLVSPSSIADAFHKSQYKKLKEQ